MGLELKGLKASSFEGISDLADRSTSKFFACTFSSLRKGGRERGKGSKRRKKCFMHSMELYFISYSTCSKIDADYAAIIGFSGI